MTHTVVACGEGVALSFFQAPNGTTFLCLYIRNPTILTPEASFLPFQRPTEQELFFLTKSNFTQVADIGNGPSNGGAFSPYCYLNNTVYFLSRNETVALLYSYTISTGQLNLIGPTLANGIFGFTSPNNEFYFYDTNLNRVEANGTITLIASINATRPILIGLIFLLHLLVNLFLLIR